MPDARRIRPDEAYRKVVSGEASLICAYEDDEKCRQIALAGAIPLSQFEAELPRLPRNRELIFYCA